MTYGQKRKGLIRQIEQYKNTTIYNTAFDCDINSLKVVLHKYFQQQRFKMISESDSDITFYTNKTVKCLRRQPPRGSNTNTPNQYVRCRIEIYVAISISNFESRKKVNISPRYHNLRANASSNISEIIGGYKFDESSLRRYLYIKYHGKTIPLPDNLLTDVNNYNSTQSRDRKKILPGRDY
ncbi:MAG: hypothetical protein COB88_06425 [Flavobacteriales bacterium]|nr:MAG: hypothetical protein COB88_06425 [Flavobacteriales bacterium]